MKNMNITIIMGCALFIFVITGCLSSPGVINKEASTPDIYAARDAGASEVPVELLYLPFTKEARGLVITLSGSFLFTSDRSILLAAAKNRLDQITDTLMKTKERTITVEGHTDSQGIPINNQILSFKRADAVRYYIISRGYPSDLIRAVGVGEDRPVANNTSPVGRATNRRVEIIIEHATQ
jgi:outer membrane protein OmpA-like peptidoglycan-associated protein